MHDLAQDPDVYRKKYLVMRRKLRLLVYEQHSFVEELKKSQRKLLKVARDKTFLLDRLVDYEDKRGVSNHMDSSVDSENTASSDDDVQVKRAVSKKSKIRVASSVFNRVKSSKYSTSPKVRSFSKNISSKGAPSAHLSTFSQSSDATASSIIRLETHNFALPDPITSTPVEVQPLFRPQEVEKSLDYRQLHHESLATTAMLPDNIFDDEAYVNCNNNSASLSTFSST